MIAPPPASALEFSATFPLQRRSILTDNSSLHLAYSVSPDNRWIVAVWTDDWGHVCLKECYCLSRPISHATNKSVQLQSPENVYAQIWQRTLEITKQAKINWKVIIVRVGGMTRNEIGMWNSLREGTPPDLQDQIRLFLVCVDLNPPLAVSIGSGAVAETSPLAMSSTFPSSNATFSQSSPAGVGNAYGTPVATPLAQPNESPDPSGGVMSTPGGTATAENLGEFDPEARWMDAKDEVWAILLNHRVPTCRCTAPENDIRFSLASGFVWHVKTPVPHKLVQV